MKTTVFKKPAYVLCQEAEAKGLSVSVNSLVDFIRTDLNKELSTYFKRQIQNFKAYYDIEEWSEIENGINQYIKDEKLPIGKLQFDGSARSEVYLLPITEHLALKVFLYDEYYGAGDSSSGVHIDRFIITEEATTLDVDALVEMMKTYRII